MTLEADRENCLGSVDRSSNALAKQRVAPKLLLVDDDWQLLGLINEWLKHQGFDVVTASDGAECQKLLQINSYDLVVLDWLIPEVSGLEICRWFRAIGGCTPILILSAKDEIEAKEVGLEAGADDYMTKPFHLRELTVRLKALLRRSPMILFSRVIQIGPLTIDPDQHTATVHGEQLNLTGTEFAVLEYLARHPNQVFTTRELLDCVWKRDSANPDTVRVYLNRLKDKLDSAGYRELIQNIHGVGYKIDPKAITATTQNFLQTPQSGIVV